MGEANSTTVSFIKPKVKERKQCRFVTSVTALWFRRRKEKKPTTRTSPPKYIWNLGCSQTIVCHSSEIIYCACTDQSMFLFAKFLLHKWFFLSGKLYTIVWIFLPNSFILVWISAFCSVFVFAIRTHDVQSIWIACFTPAVINFKFSHSKILKISSGV